MMHRELGLSTLHKPMVLLHAGGLPSRPLVRSTLGFFLRMPLLQTNLLAPGLGGVGTARAEGEAPALVLAMPEPGWAGAGAGGLGRKRWKSADTQSVHRLARLICVYPAVSTRKPKKWPLVVTLFTLHSWSDPCCRACVSRPPCGHQHAQHCWLPPTLRCWLNTAGLYWPCERGHCSE